MNNLLRARKLILFIGLCAIAFIVAMGAVAIYFLQEKEKNQNAERTENARKARWANKKETGSENESFKDLEQTEINLNEGINRN